MKLDEIINESFGDTEEIVVIEEGLFSVSPAIAMLAFKDNIFDKIKSGVTKGTDAAKDAVGTIAAGKEKLKAQTLGRSGNKDDDTVYSLTKEQKKVMSYIYRKYGAEMVNKISDFRKNIMPPYNLLKRTVAKGKMLTNKEVFGMTKEEYYKYRESGRKKIEKKGTYFKDFKDLNSKQTEAREALKKAEKTLADFKAGKMVDLSASNLEKVWELAGISRKKQNGWTDNELEKTVNEIKKYEEFLKDSGRFVNGNPENIRVSGRNNGEKMKSQSRSQIEDYIKRLRENGISSANGKPTEDDNHHGSFKDALNVYLLRREKINEIRNASLNSEYKKFYTQVLQDSIDSAKKIYNEKFSNFNSLSGSVELNKFEEKIWGLKATGRIYSGDINQWYLKIKPEDFIETKYYKKSEKVVKAEQELDRLLKQLERDLKKVMSEEDVALCRKYRLFNNFITVKELRDPKNMFKDSSDLKNLKPRELADDDFEDRLSSAMGKEFNSIRDLEDEQEKIKELASGKKLDGDIKKKYKEFMNRINPKNGSSATKVSRSKITEIIDEIMEKAYTGKTEASNDLSKLEDVVSDYKEVNGEEDFKQFNYDYNKAKSKLVSFIQGDK